MMAARDSAGPRLSVERGLALAAPFLLLVLLGALAAFSRRYIDLHIGLPGHAGFLWLFFLVLGRGLVPRHGAGLAVGLSSALWAGALGPGKGGLLLVLATDTLAAGAVDLVAGWLDRRSPERMTRLAHPLGAMLAGALAHGIKFGLLLAWPAAGVRVALLGWPALASHLLFGAAAGLAAALVLQRWARPGRDSSPER